MAKTAVHSAEQSKANVASGLDTERLIEMYRLMYLSRRTDDREILLKRQQKIFFQISGAGHEALLVAAGMALKPGYDWFFPYYRDRALCLALGSTVEELLLQGVGAAADPSSGGRQMPSHWGNQRLNIVSQSSATSTQMLHAVGCAEAGRYFAHHPESAGKNEDDYRAFKDVTFHGDEVVYASLGEGSTSQGEFWEALNTASNQKLPVLFVVENNEYAISTPVEVNTPGGNISKLVANFPNFYFAEVDGTDPVESFRVFEEAVAYCRAGKGRLLCMDTSFDRIRIRYQTTTASIVRKPSATPIRCAIRCRRCRCSCCARAFSIARRSIAWNSRWTKRYGRLPIELCALLFPNPRAFRCTSTPKTMIRLALNCRRSLRRLRRRRSAQWPTSSMHA